MKRLLCAGLAALLALSLFAGCSKKNADPVPVQSVGLITGIGAVGIQNRFAGMVTSGDTVAVDKNEDMAVAELRVAAGDTVRAGDVLFVYDTEALQLNYERQKLELEQLQNTLTAKEAQIAQLEKDKAKAPSSQQLDYAIEIQNLQIDVMETKINIKAKEKEVAVSEAALNDAEVRAPSDGRVQAVNQNGGTDNNGNPLPYITLVQTDEYRVKGTLNEQNRGSLTEGDRVTVYSRVDDGVWYGVVFRIDWDAPETGGGNNNYFYDAGDEMSSASKYPFYVQLDSSDGLLLGQHVYLEVGEVGDAETPALMLPSWFIADAEGSPYVWAATRRDTLEKRSVTLGSYDEMTDSYEILSGLTAEDYIAVPGENCANGVPVTRYDEGGFTDPNAEIDFGGIDEGGFDNGGVFEGDIFDGGEDGGEDGGFFEGGEDGGVIYDGAGAEG